MGIQQDFIVVDNICGDLDFEDGGNPVVMNRVMAACDPVLVDAYVCQMMHYEVAEVPYVKLAGELGWAAQIFQRQMSDFWRMVRIRGCRYPERLWNLRMLWRKWNPAVPATGI